MYFCRKKWIRTNSWKHTGRRLFRNKLIWLCRWRICYGARTLKIGRWIRRSRRLCWKAIWKKKSQRLPMQRFGLIIFRRWKTGCIMRLDRVQGASISAARLIRLNRVAVIIPLIKKQAAGDLFCRSRLLWRARRGFWTSRLSSLWVLPWFFVRSWLPIMKKKWLILKLKTLSCGHCLTSWYKSARMILRLIATRFWNVWKTAGRAAKSKACGNSKCCGCKKRRFWNFGKRLIPKLPKFSSKCWTMR